MAKYSVGLDIGISSVGWSIIDVEKKQIIDLGSRIFPSRNAAANQDRRTFRGTRRLIRRRKNRLLDLKKLLAEKEFFVNFDEPSNPYVLRVKGLTEQLSKEELAASLYHIVNRRGISYDLGDLEDDGKSGVSDYGSAINENRRLLVTGKTVGQIQLERLDEFSQVRGQVKVDDETSLLNVFPSSAYVKETEQILMKQREFYPELTNEFIEMLCRKDEENPKNNGLILRKREYFVGPGSEKSPTKYGLYRLQNGKIKKIGDNLFDKLIGTDKINDEKRASASSLIAQIYNLLNDLNNLTVPNTEDGKITTDTKKEILSAAKTADGQFGITQICKIIGAKKEEVKGFRIDKSEKPIIHTLTGYRKFRKALAEIGVEANELDPIFFDKIADILTLNTEKAEIRKQLDKAEFVVADEIKELIVNKNKELLVDRRATWHSFSYKTLNLLIPELLNTSEEQMTILTRLGLMKPDNEKYKGLKNIPALKITEEIYNPVVAKSTREAINVFNAIAKRVGSENIEHVVIELPRDANEDEAQAKKEDKKRQDAAKNERDKADELIKQQMTISDNALKAQYQKYKKLSQKVRYWYQQEGICPYCGKKIEAVQLINNNDNFEVDHIIPISASFDDAQNNKVLVHSQCNQEKAQQTPLGWINNGGGFGQTKAEYIAKVRSNKHYTKNKMDNLLNDADLSDIMTRRSFIQRNLNDTRYASRVVLDEFYSFFKSNDLPTKVKVVRGKWTSQMRKKWNGVGGLAKTRETHHHHAIDASIIASFPLLKAFDKAIELLDIDKETGEILQDKEAVKKAREANILKQWAVIKSKDFEKLVDELYDFPLFKQVELANDIENPNNPVKFSHRVDKKANRAVANQTIYGTRIKKMEVKKRGKTEIIQDEYTFGTIKNIYNVDDFAKFKKLYDEANKKEDIKFLMQEKDSKTWDKLVKVLKDYPDFEEKTQTDGKVKVMPISPFELYRRDNGFITKYAKHDNGPKVVSLKYYDSKIGSHIDITPKNAKNKVVLQSLKPWRTDVYFNPDTQQYELLGLKYADLKFTKGVYGITESAYENLKHGIEADGTILWKPIGKNSEFRFSLYRNDRFRFTSLEEGETLEALYSSLNVDGRSEIKPIHKSAYSKGENNIPVIGKIGDSTYQCKINFNIKKNGGFEKVNTDILGTPYYTKKESDQPKLNL